MQATEGNRLREVSKALFGNAYRLELLAIIGEFDDPFYARQIAMQLGVADNLVTSQLGKLCELGLLEKQTVSPRVLYTRHPSCVWDMAQQLRAEFGKESRVRDGEPRGDLRDREARRLRSQRTQGSGTTVVSGPAWVAFPDGSRMLGNFDGGLRAGTIVIMDGDEYVIEEVGQTAAEQLPRTRRYGKARRFIPVVYVKQRASSRVRGDDGVLPRDASRTE